MEWQEVIDSWSDRYGCTIHSPVEAKFLDEAVSQLGSFPTELFELYKHCNGLNLRWFKVLPIEDKKSIKQTWDGLRRANDPKKTEYLGRSQKLLWRFLVFADLGGRTCAVIDRTDGSIWYQENGKLHQTNLTVLDFIDTTLKEAKELP